MTTATQVVAADTRSEAHVVRVEYKKTVRIWGHCDPGPYGDLFQVTHKTVKGKDETRLKAKSTCYILVASSEYVEISATGREALYIEGLLYARSRNGSDNDPPGIHWQVAVPQMLVQRRGVALNEVARVIVPASAPEKLPVFKGEHLVFVKVADGDPPMRCIIPEF